MINDHENNTALTTLNPTLEIQPIRNTNTPNRRELILGAFGLASVAALSLVTKPVSAAPAQTEQDYNDENTNQMPIEAAETDPVNIFIETKFNDYLNSLTSAERKKQERFRDESHNLLRNIYDDVYAERSFEEFGQVQLTKLIGFMIEDRKTAEDDPERGMKTKERPIAYAGAARTVIRLRSDNAGSHVFGYFFEENEWDAINVALQNAGRADDFYGALTSGYYKGYGDNAYVYYNPELLRQKKLTRVERFHADQWATLNGLDSDEVPIRENSGNGFNPKTKFSKKAMVFSD